MIQLISLQIIPLLEKEIYLEILQNNIIKIKIVSIQE